jgi:hypothetical protein
MRNLMKCGVNKTTANKMHNQWRGSVQIFSLVFKIRLVSWDSEAL